jgi:dipeptide transport system substrate-binding protein
MMIGFTCGALKSGRNIPQWCNRQYSDLVQQANLVTDQAARAKLYVQAQQVFYDEVPAMMFADARAFVGLRDEVHGFKLHFFGGQPFGGVSLGK